MSKEPLDYSDPQDKVDYKIVQSSGHTGRLSLKLINPYTIALVAIVLLLFLLLFSQASKISSLEGRISDLEERVTVLDGID